jgi:inhibitor of cysteine peptidase
MKAHTRENMNEGVIHLRRIVLIIMLCSMLAVPQALAANSNNNSKAVADVRLLLNGKPLQLEAQPILKDGVNYVPMRSLLTALGASVQWDETTDTVTATHNDTTVKVTINATKGWMNGKEVIVAHPPQFIGGKVYVSLRWMNEAFGAVVKWHASTRTASVYYPEKGLPRIGSIEHLKTLLSDRSNYSATTVMLTNESLQMKSDSSDASAPAAQSDTTTSSSGASDYSTTNIQVQGVDESDVVKSDGTYIYQIIEQKIVISHAYPANQMSIASTISYADRGFIPMEIYIEDGKLIVIGSSSPYLYQTNAKPTLESKRIAYPIVPQTLTTKAVVYDIHDRTAPKQIREVEMEGSYVSSRKISSSLYIVSNSNINYYYSTQEQPDIAAPTYRDSHTSDKMVPISFDEIRYFPDAIEPNFLLIGGLNLNDADQPMDVQAYLGSGQNIYASSDNLYVAVTQYGPSTSLSTEPNSDLAKRIITAPSIHTSIYKFALADGTITYMADGEVPGIILNQFSMDEHNGNFRIATTVGDVWASGEFGSQNHLYVLNEALDTIGKVENIAPGEKIYSVRFMGDRAYMVTFKTVDPLFVIDVSDPTQPNILGALKIPGYSDYLHPYDENHIIGFGKDTMEQSYKDEKGNVIRTTAYYLGMKVAMFDVTDVANPKELHTMKIGDRGTNSELLHNHKALLFSKAKNLMAFPVELYEQSANSTSPLEYGQFTYQGAYVYNIDLAKGFSLKGRITHISDDELSKAGNYWYDYNKNVRRILYMDDTLYTLSNSMIKAHTLSDLQPIGSLNIPQ